MSKSFLVCLLFCSSIAYSQTVTGRTQAGTLKPNVTKPQPAQAQQAPAPLLHASAPGQAASPGMTNQINAYTPFLTADIMFQDSSGDNVLSADESAVILVSLRNMGGKPAQDCQIELVPSVANSGISAVVPPVIAQILPSDTVNAMIFLRAAHNISTGSVEFTLKVMEKNGFDLDPEKVLVIPTHAFEPPRVELVDYGVQDPNRTGRIEKREVVTVTLRMQNRGGSTSYGTNAVVTLGPNVLPIDVDPSYNLGDLKAGQFKDINATIVTNDRATEVGMDIAVSDRSGKYTYLKKLELPFDVPQKKPDEIVVAARKGDETNIPDVADLKLDIAENIPKAAGQKPNAFAVVIGNRDYIDAPKVDFALNDAAIMKRYLITTMGYKPENILYFENATQADMTLVFGNDVNYKGRLFDFVRQGSEVFIYYSGHGAPDTDSKEGYIVPVDCDPTHVALNGYSLKTLYSNLDKIDAEKGLKHITVVLDACFSGSSVGGTLLANVSPIYITVNKDVMASGNTTIITSASGDQVSGWYNDKRQSLFTYFFLKGLQGGADYEHNNIITAKELYEFTADEVNGVPYWSRRLNSKTQTPTFFGSDWVIYDGAK